MYKFEGEYLKVSQIHELVPRLSITTIRNYLRAGMKTRIEMLTYDPGPCWRNAGRKRKA